MARCSSSIRASPSTSPAQTLEQVLSRRRKMLMDMANGIELELRDMLKDTKAAEKLALNILRKAMDYFYRNYSLEWFNNGWLGRPAHIPLPSAPPPPFPLPLPKSS